MCVDGRQRWARWRHGGTERVPNVNKSRRVVDTLKQVLNEYYCDRTTETLAMSWDIVLPIFIGHSSFFNLQSYLFSFKMIDTEQFIIEIQQNDCIWNKQERSHHDSQAIHVGWTNVANACVHNFNELDNKQKSEKIKDLKLKWKNIKDNYRKKCIHKSGQAAKSDKPYVYANILEFLRPTMENRNTESNVAAQNDREYTTDNENVITEEAQEANHSGVSEEESPVVRKKKKTTENSFENQLISVLKERRVSNDPVTSFLMSLAPQIRKMTEDQQNQVYIEMIQIIQKVKTSKNSDQMQPQSIPSSVSNSTFQPLQCSYNNTNSYPTYPFNFHLPTTSYISNASPTPSTITNMPINYEPHNITGNNSSFVSITSQKDSNIHRHQLYYPHTQSTALTPQPPVTPNDTATVNSYYLQKNSPHTASSTTSIPTGHSDNSYYTNNLTPDNTNSQ